MKRTLICISLLLPAIMYSTTAFSQRKTGSENMITSSDLESNVTFLASPLLKGRKDGEEGLDIAAQYIASQAKLTGLHTDYHTPGDIVEKIDFKKMELITRTMYNIGLTLANKKTRIVVDNPYSSWGKIK